jgi:tetratricopeptide (TPR) repeat protein
MTDTVFEEMRKTLFNQLNAVAQSRDLTQFDALIEEARSHNQLDIAIFIEARKQFAMAEYKQAVALSDAAFQLNPRLAAAQYVKAAALIETSFFDEAINVLNEILKQVWTTNPEIAFFNKGIAYARKGDGNSAKFCFLMAIDVMPDYKPAYVSLLDIEATDSNWNEVLKISHKIGETFAKDAGFLNEIVTHLLQRTEIVASGGKPDIAKLLITEARIKSESALSLDPNNPSILYNYACTMARAGDRVGAIEALKKAIAGDRDRTPPNNYKSMARNDPDFSTLLDDAEFQQLVGFGTKA